MKEIIYYNTLYDYYKSLLTETQRKYFKDYYFNNYTFDEIAEKNNVSKSAISKSINQTIDKLKDLEGNLKLHHKNKQIKTLLSEEEYNKIKELI